MPPMDLLENQVLERLIMRELQVQRALQTGIRVSDTDVDQTLVNLAQQNGITVQQLRQVIEKDGEDFTEFRRNIGEELMTERLRQRIVNGMDPITDTEVDIMLTSQDLEGGEYNISHIMISLPDGSTPTQIQEAQTKADDLHARLVDGLDFASAAISYSDSQEALEGGQGVLGTATGFHYMGTANVGDSSHGVVRVGGQEGVVRFARQVVLRSVEIGLGQLDAGQRLNCGRSAPGQQVLKILGRA